MMELELYHIQREESIAMWVLFAWKLISNFYNSRNKLSRFSEILIFVKNIKHKIKHCKIREIINLSL